MIGEYLADAPYRFSIAFGRETFEDFWGRTSANYSILAQRRQWLAEDERKYLAALPGSRDLLVEAAEIGIASGTLPPSVLNLTTASESSSSPIDLARSLAELWEPDFLVLRREADAVRLVAGSVCFPSSWSLEEKIGQPIEAIHEVVPSLNANIGPQIRTFLERIKPGVSWTRSNWGLSRSPEWNQHPSRGTPRLDRNVSLEQVFFRVEEQSLVALPRHAGILFGIRLKVAPLAGCENTKEGLRLAALLETMSDAMAQYKGLSQTRGRIVTLLRGGG